VETCEENAVKFKTWYWLFQTGLIISKNICKFSVWLKVQVWVCCQCKRKPVYW